MRMLRIGDKMLVCMVSIILLICVEQAIAQSAPSTAILIELFTSEGCSDCPPADEFLRTLDRTQPVTGAQLVVLEEHVDYWDDLGWRDPFSSHAFTERQTDYVGRLRLATAYTPQMIVDGTYQFVGSDRHSAAKVFEISRNVQKVPVHIVSPTIQNQMLLAHIESGPVPSKAEAWLALAIEHAESQVLKGENGGHHLEHVAIVRNLTRIGKVGKGESFSKDISVSAKSFAQPGRVIVFLQAPDQGKILGAAVERLTPETATRK